VKTSKRALRILRYDIKDEKKAQAEYGRLIKALPGKRDKKAVRRIRSDERKHGRVLKKILGRLR
jgi:rubrerythrin